MKVFTIRVFLIELILLLCSNLVVAQDVKPLPVDPRIKTGKLANGLTYYIFKNSAMKGVADFSIGVKAGTTLEKENQKGMFKALELLSTRGTRSFTDSTMVTYLKSLGVRENDINFYTGEEQIEYSIKNLNISNQNTMDSALLILYNWLSSINIDEEDIVAVAPMVKNSLINLWGADKRMDYYIMNQLYKDNPYLLNLSKEEISKIDNISSKELRNFYYKWFRADLQAIFIVGDVDLAKVETQVKSIFSTIPKVTNAGRRGYYKPKLPQQTKIVIAKDIEYDKVNVSINFLAPPLLSKYKLTSVPYIEEYFNYAITTLLNSRIRSGVISQNLPISNISINKDRFMGMMNMESFTISFDTRQSSLYSAIAFLSGEVNNLARYGFNGQEFINSRNLYFKEIEKLYDNRLSLPNSIFMQRLKDNFFEGYSLASIEMKFEILKEVLFNLKNSELNSYANALLGDKNNCVISCKVPDVKGSELLSKERILASFTNALSKNVANNAAETVVRWPRFDENQKFATILESSVDPITGADVIVLSNGVTAILKRNLLLGDTLSFKAVSKGGLALMDNLGKNISLYINDIVNLGGLGDFTQVDLDKLLEYNNIKVRARFTDNSDILEGYAIKENADKLFHIINMNFTKRRGDSGAFDIYKKGKKEEAIYHNLSPLNVFADSVRYYNCSNKKYFVEVDEDFVDSMNYSQILSTVNSRFSGVKDFVFAFAGDIHLEDFKNYVVKYLGSIPTNDLRVTDAPVKPKYISKGKRERWFLHQMVIPRSYISMMLSLGVENNIENAVLGDMLKGYLESQFNSGSIRGLASKSSINSSLQNYPEDMFLCNMQFETDSAGAKPIVEIVKNILNNVSNSGLKEKDFSLLKNNLSGEFNELCKKNNFWIETLINRFIFSADYYSAYLNVLEGITNDRFREFVSEIIERGNLTTIVMEGTTEDVNTQNLFRENEFIMEFFKDI